MNLLISNAYNNGMGDIITSTNSPKDSELSLVDSVGKYRTILKREN